jgi:8-oxo-dGTP pyrophosphatase MutT (NUDIX family)
MTESAAPKPDTRPAIPSATILLVRDHEGAMEVLMVERHYQIDFASGALVFPGGKAAPADYEEEWLAHCTGHEGLTPFERAMRIAALREAFEESGILLAAGAASLALADQREAVNADATLFRPAVAGAGFKLDLGAIAPWAHWVTPIMMPKRFDTYFFIARAPDGQFAEGDGGEAVDAVWLTPEDALAQAKAGTRKIIFPTRLQIEMLAAFGTVDAAMAGARARQIITVQPWVVQENGQPTLKIPPEAGYATTSELLEGNG